MQTYETTFIVNPQAEDSAIDHQVSAVVDLIKNNGGEVRHEDRIGSRRLAYAINGLTQGYYASIIFDAPNTVLPVLERHYRLGEAYIRHLTIRFEGELEAPVAEPKHAAAVEEKPEPVKIGSTPRGSEAPAVGEVITEQAEAVGEEETAAEEEPVRTPAAEPESQPVEEVDSEKTEESPPESPKEPEMDDEL